ncbi:uncharacterized protein [Haliotis cracherodii]|uniref:uncharacterized protein isoform X1 n=1 Tax=Haliotis cracherodii TaxID=6455 RepID=UPI0039E76F81
MGKPKSATKKQRKAVPKRKPKKMGKPKSATKKQRNAVPKSKPKSRYICIQLFDRIELNNNFTRNGKTEICAEESEKSCFKSWLFGSETVGDSLQNNTLLKMKKKVPKRK